MDIMSLFGFNKPQPKQQTQKKGGYKISVSSGLYSIARSDELQTLVKKVGYALTRGTGAIEIASDVPHEINFTEGQEIRYIAQHQGIELTLHGDLQVGFEMPDRTEWVNAQDKFQKSIKSAVYGGCNYVNFHSCLREWLELFTYAGQRLELIMCDHLGRSISNLFREDKSGKLAKWFISTSAIEDSPENRYKRKHDFVNKYIYNILGREGIEKINSYISKVSSEEVIRRAIDKIENLNIPPEAKQQLRELFEDKTRPIQQKIDTIIQYGILNREEIVSIEKSISKKITMEEVEKNVNKDWFDEGIRGGSLEDIYIIMAHYLYFNKDPLWVEMEKIYADILNYHNIEKDDDWLLKLIDKANAVADAWSLRFKEFYYGVVGAKYLQGHVIRAIEWMIDEKSGLKKIIKEEVNSIISDPKKREQEEKVLFDNIKKLKICFETPDARNPELGGRFTLWKTKQIYLAVKNIRKELEKNVRTKDFANNIFMIIDWEHVATQGVDPFNEAEDFIKAIKILGDENGGDLILGVHANYPSPLQPHKPIEIADRPIIYSLLYKLRKIGFGKNQMVYLLFERGGGENPFKGSIIALKTIAEELEKETPPDQLPISFYGISEGTRDFSRQRVIIKEHALEPLKGLLKVPEEDYTFLGSSAIKGGKQPDQWKKEELR